MYACLTDHDLAAYADGSAAAEQMSAWNEHLDDCEVCAARVVRKQAGVSTSGDADRGRQDVSAAAETVTVQPPVAAPLDAGAGLPEDAIPGYRILKELHRGGQGVVYQAVQ